MVEVLRFHERSERRWDWNERNKQRPGCKFALRHRNIKTDTLRFQH